MGNKNNSNILEKHKTKIPGFDFISAGGLPKHRTTLVSGTAGSAKTVFASQFLAEGIIKENENGVFVTFEETPNDIQKNMKGFGWDIEKWETEGKWAFVDVSPQPETDNVISGGYDLGPVLLRIEHAVLKIGAKRMSLDSLGAIFSQFTETSIVRKELFRIASAIRKMGVTAILTSERINEYGEIARFGVEEFVADNVIILRNVLEVEKRRRTIEILKFRGTSHYKGEYPFTVIPGEGIIIIPLSDIELKQKSSNIRVTSGNQILDKMCGSGYYRDSILLLSGATGTGKTLMTTEFIKGGFNNGECCLLFAFEESHEQLIRNASGWGIDYEEMEKIGKLKIICEYPEVKGLEDHLIYIKKRIDEFSPKRVAIDSLSALERVSTVKSYREFVIGLTSYIKHKEIVGLLTATTPTLVGGTSITEAHISTITDLIILLRYVEIGGEMRRGLTVLKMRGSMHDKDIREYSIDHEGMHIGKSFKNVSGILSGTPTHIGEREVDRLKGIFEEQ